MRPETPAVPDRDALADYVDECGERVDGRLGVLLGYPRGETMDAFDVVVARGADRPYASASVIKLPVLYALYRRYDGNLDALDGPREVGPDNLVGGSGLLHLLDEPEPSLRDLARAMIAVSDNAATNELIDHLGLDAVNDAAADLGMADTRLARKLMTTLDDGTADEGDDVTAEGDDGDDGTTTAPDNTTSPRDCARFFAALLHGDDLSAAAREEQLGILRDQKDISTFRRYYPYDLPVAHKTGWIPDAALDTGLIETADPPLFFAAFCDRCSHGGDATDVLAEVGDATLAWLRT